MNIRVLEPEAMLTLSSALEALKILQDLDADHRGVGLQFVELQYAPDVQEQRAAHLVATELLEMGVGCSLRVHWPFQGTRHWALQTERSRVVSEA